MEHIPNYTKVIINNPKLKTHGLRGWISFNGMNEENETYNIYIVVSNKTHTYKRENFEIVVDEFPAPAPDAPVPIPEEGILVAGGGIAPEPVKEPKRKLIFGDEPEDPRNAVALFDVVDKDAFFGHKIKAMPYSYRNTPPEGCVYKGFLEVWDKIVFLHPETNIAPYLTETMPLSGKLFDATGDGYLRLFNHTEYSYCADWIDFDKTKLRGDTIEVEVEADVDENNEELLSVIRNACPRAIKTKLSFGLLYHSDDGIKMRESFGRNCHYDFKSRQMTAVKEYALYAVQYFTKKKQARCLLPKRDVLSKYYKWMMESSPWKNNIIFTGLDRKDNYENFYEFLLENPVLVRLDTPTNAMMCTFYALRYPAEFGGVVDKWNKLTVEYDCNPNAAFYLAECMLDGNLGQLMESYGHHNLLDTRFMGIDDLKTFIRGGEGANTNSTNWLKSGNYSNVSKYHGSFTSEEVNGGEETALTFLKNKFTGDFVVEKHPILGEIKKHISSLDQIVTYLNEMVE